jgi:hypothetical protein
MRGRLSALFAYFAGKFFFSSLNPRRTQNSKLKTQNSERLRRYCISTAIDLGFTTYFDPTI